MEPSVQKIIAQFGEDAKVKDVARYLHDEYLIPYDEAVKLIYDSIESYSKRNS